MVPRLWPRLWGQNGTEVNGAGTGLLPLIQTRRASSPSPLRPKGGEGAGHRQARSQKAALLSWEPDL